jgi:hypothetical protein
MVDTVGKRKHSPLGWGKVMKVCVCVCVCVCVYVLTCTLQRTSSSYKLRTNPVDIFGL